MVIISNHLSTKSFPKHLRTAVSSEYPPSLSRVTLSILSQYDVSYNRPYRAEYRTGSGRSIRCVKCSLEKTTVCSADIIETDPVLVLDECFYREFNWTVAGLHKNLLAHLRGRVQKFPAWPTFQGDRNKTNLLFFSLYFNTLFTSVN